VRERGNHPGAPTPKKEYDLAVDRQARPTKPQPGTDSRHPDPDRGRERPDGPGGRRTPKPPPRALHRPRVRRHKYTQWERKSHGGARPAGPPGTEKGQPPVEERERRPQPPDWKEGGQERPGSRPDPCSEDGDCDGSCAKPSREEGGQWTDRGRVTDRPWGSETDRRRAGDGQTVVG
jgi:hypothetical protein